MKPQRRGDEGAAMILAILLVFTIGILLVTITNFAGASAVTTYNLRAQRTSELAAENAVTTAISQVRSNPDLCATSPSYLANFTVLCSQVVEPGSINTRTVDFYACPNATSTNKCSTTPPGVILHATVIYDDVPPNNPFGSVCVPGGAHYSCGILTSIQAWDVIPADT